MTSLSLAIFILYLTQGILSVIPDNNGKCVPGELVWVDCNLCTCNLQGMPNEVCAKMWCQPQPKSKNSPPDYFDDNEALDLNLPDLE